MSRHPLPDRAEAARLLGTLAARAPAAAPPPIDKPGVLYGAGNLGRLAAAVLEAQDVPIAYAIDRNPPPDGLLLGRIPVLRPEDAPAADHARCQVAVCVVLAPYAPIRDFLQDLGWRHIAPFYDLADAYAGREPLNNGWFAGALDDTDQAQIAAVLDAWDDDHSRAAHLQFLAWRVARDEWQFDGAPVDTGNRYFIPPVLAALRPDERFLDTGAWHGSVSQRFIAETGGRFGEIVAIEADRGNLPILRNTFAALPADQALRTRILDCALADHDGEQAFAHGHDLTSRLMPDAPGTAPCRSLDSLDLPLGFAKLHLEGGELAALTGARRVLQRDRPLLAITAYHNRDGLWRLPALLMGLLSDYRFLFRMHAWCGTGAVLYAIPRERSRAA